MTRRTVALGHVKADEIIHAASSNGASSICLVLAVTDSTIQTRTVTTQLDLAFNRTTGVAEWGEDSIRCAIDSLEPVPSDIHEALLSMD